MLVKTTDYINWLIKIKQFVNEILGQSITLFFFLGTFAVLTRFNLKSRVAPTFSLKTLMWNNFTFISPEMIVFAEEKPKMI